MLDLVLKLRTLGRNDDDCPVASITPLNTMYSPLLAAEFQLKSRSQALSSEQQFVDSQPTYLLS
jgi:hypothetical protein